MVSGFLGIRRKGVRLGLAKNHRILAGRSRRSPSCKASSLEKELLARLAGLVEQTMPEVFQIIVFGSRARGESNEHSDLDVAIIVDVPYSAKTMWQRLWDMKWRVLETLNAEEFPLSMSIVGMDDLVSKNSGLEKAVKSEGILIWERNCPK